MQAAQQGILHELQQLLSVHAAAELPAAALQDLLLSAVGHELGTTDSHHGPPELNLIKQLRALPAASQLTAEALAYIVMSVLHWEKSAGHKQPYGRCVPDANGVIQLLLQVPAAELLPAECTKQLLLAAIAGSEWDWLDYCCCLPAVGQVGAEAAEQVYQTALDQGN